MFLYFNRLLSFELYDNFVSEKLRIFQKTGRFNLSLVLIHLISIPVTNTSVNPARSISQAIFAGDWALGQLWLFIVVPIAGAALAGIVYQYFKSK